MLNVTSRSGIGRAKIRRKSPQWPKVLVVRLHLTGLESFRITAAEKALEWSVSSSGDHAVRVAWRSEGRGAAGDGRQPAAQVAADRRWNGRIPTQGRLL